MALAMLAWPPVCWAVPPTLTALPRSLWRSREEGAEGWLGLWTGGSASLRTSPRPGRRQARLQDCRVKLGSSKAQRLDRVTSTSPEPKRLTGLGGYLASQLCPWVLHPPAIPRTLTPPSSLLKTPLLPPSLHTARLPTVHTWMCHSPAPTCQGSHRSAPSEWKALFLYFKV